MKCTECDIEMKFYWGGNPDGNFAHECPKCKCYILNNVKFKNYSDCEKNYVAELTLADQILGCSQ